MTPIAGYWYPAGSSTRRDAALTVDGDRFVVRDAAGGELTGSFSAVAISPRVGSIPRKLTLPDQSLFETEDNSAVDRLAASARGNRSSSLLHHLESRWHWIGISLIAVLLFIFASVRWGLPWVSNELAQRVPEPVLERVSVSSLELLDEWFLQPSTLDDRVQRETREQFDKQVGNPNDGSFTLHFRKMGMPNAFALPSGDLVATDSFVRLATQEEFTAVMLHEIGHVEHRHGMQQMVRSSIITFLVAVVLGEPSGLEELIVALPVFLLQSSYSRKHELEADTYAFEKMMEAGIDPIHFATIMRKMESWHDRFDESDDHSTNQEKKKAPPSDEHRKADRQLEKERDNGDEDSDKGVFGYLSSHPATELRIRRAEALSKQFRQGSVN